MGNSSSEHMSDSENMATRENLRSLSFHKICGNNIVLLQRNKIAHRTDGFCEGLTFTDRPVAVNEPIRLRVKQTATNWSGALRIGFTMNDPSLMKSKLPPHSCPDFVKEFGNWAKAIPEVLNKQDSVIVFYLNECGIVRYQHDGKDKKILLSGVQTSSPMWGVIDVYGNTVSVELLVNQENDMSNFDLTFHEVHGEHITMDDARTVATISNGVSLSYVFSDEPMKFDEKVVVKILEKDPIIMHPFEYGITVCDPATLSSVHLPARAENLLDRSEYWVLKQDFNAYECDDVLVFTLTDEGTFLVTKNGTSVPAKFHVDNSKPLWLFFKLSSSIKSIGMMGTSFKETADLVKEFKNLKVSKRKEHIAQDSPKVSSDLSVGECVICYENPINCTLYRCGHMCMCYECAYKIKNAGTSDIKRCPVCRKPIEDVIKVYV